MKIEKLHISGFRGFKEFTIESSELTGFIILAGQNGTGKSTILEIVNFILRNLDIGMIDESITQGVTGGEGIWELTGSFKEEEIVYLGQILKNRSPQVYENIDTYQLIKNSLRSDSGSFVFSIKITIPSTITQNSRATRKYLGNSTWEDTPSWFTELATQQIFLVYINPLQEIGQAGASIFGGAIKDLDMVELSSTDADIRKRGIRTNVNLTSLLNRLALMDLWKMFEDMNKSFPTLERELEKINQIISPLEIFFDVHKLKSGEIVFKMKNNKLDKIYPMQYASAGEKQVIGLAALMIQWQRQQFKQVVLIDEPDTHLHPEFATRLAKFIKQIFPSSSEFSCIVASHSSDFIAENLENVYQITTDSTTIERIENLEMRANLLQQLGKKFDLSFLIAKVILLEGVDRSSNHMEDYEIYQKLIDRDKNKVVFIPVGTEKESFLGGKVAVVNRTQILKEFIENITRQQDSLKIQALIDKDRELLFGSNASIIYTPFTNLENIFLLQLGAVAKAATTKSKRFTINDIKSILESNETGSTTKLMNINGKDHLKKLFTNLSQQSQEVKNLGMKGFQIKIFSNMKIESFPAAVKQFFTESTS